MYPQSYDNLSGLDLTECVMFTHLLTDGIIDVLDYIELGTTLTFFVRYGSGIPKASIINPHSGEYLIKDVVGVYSEITTLYKFDILIPEYGTMNDTLSDIWKDGTSILKINSETSDIIFTRRLNIISTENQPATRATVNEIKTTVEELLRNESEQTENIKTLSNGWKLIF